MKTIKLMDLSREPM